MMDTRSENVIFPKNYFTIFLKAMINYDIGGEYITSKLVAKIEEKKLVPAFPLQYYIQ